MTSSELLSLLNKHITGIAEIPAPEIPANLPAHEIKPYRDAILYVNCPKEQWLKCAQLLKTEPNFDFDFLTMVTAVDYAKVNPKEPQRMDVVYHLFSLKHRHKMVVKISLPRDNGIVSSVIALWPTADWQEREVYDMYGILFDGHPNCTRILMWDGFPGWPLRKDFAHIPDRYDD